MTEKTAFTNDNIYKLKLKIIIYMSYSNFKLIIILFQNLIANKSLILVV